MADHEASLSTIFRRYRRGGELRLLTCMAVSIIALLLLAGIASAVIWLRAYIRFQDMGGGSTFLTYVFREDYYWAGGIALGLWLLLQFWIWRPAITLNRHSLTPEARLDWGRPILISACIGAGTILCTFIIHSQPSPDTAYLVAAVSMLGGGLALLFWLPIVFSAERGRPVMGPNNRTNIFCPECGHAMNGLTSAQCPECGRQYTLDELVRLQGYEIPRGEGENGDGANGVGDNDSTQNAADS
jgi:hypothetical protein